jgi:Na+:H+ antiporter, NhaC family
MAGRDAKLPAALFAIGALLLAVSYGLIIRPLVLEQAPLPLELVFLLAAVIAISQLFYLGVSWQSIQMSITAKLTQAIPTILLLFAIGLLIGSWIVSGTIAMLIYYALEIVSPEHIYFLAFVVPIFFSLCTGTSWGAIATVGLVLITVAFVFNADLAITTGAIVGGSYFGDKLSPLSDTTNIAAVATKVPLHQHIHSMLVTTVPSSLLAASLFFLLDYIYPAQTAPLSDAILSVQTSQHVIGIASVNADILQQTLTCIATIFNFNLLLLLPPLIVIIGSLSKQPPVPVLILSSLIASLLALIFQDFSLDQVIQTLYHGFNINMTSAMNVEAMPAHVAALFNRGGLYALNEPIMITLMVFIYIGAIDCIKAIPQLINYLLGKVNSPSSLVATTLLASATTNALTSSQYANSFIVGEAFSLKYDQLKVPRKVLSRSLEDTGTMIESLVPWSTTAVFIYATLGVAVQDYWHWQLLSLINIPLAFIFAYCGIGLFRQNTPLENLPYETQASR